MEGHSPVLAWESSLRMGGVFLQINLGDMILLSCFLVKGQGRQMLGVAISTARESEKEKEQRISA